MRSAVVALALVVIALAAAARADIGSVSPGKLSRAHAAFDSQCDRCHVPFGGVPADRCNACHTRLAERIAAGVGFHATVTAQPCTACHGEHKGRDAALSPPPPNPFDHRLAVFALDGRHAQLPCERCHPSRQWVGIAGACSRCHADKAHRGTLGPECEKCHRAEAWTPATRSAADHKISLAGGHQKLTCAGCHRSGAHLVAKQTCAQCHVPRHGGTTRPCETCHEVASWKQVSYVHAFAPARLPGTHQTAPCLACHPKFRFQPTSFDCAACHDKQRPHGPLGACEQCHTALTWHTRTFEHDRPEVGFALTGRHAAVDCEACHKSGFGSAVPAACEGCHANVHGEQFPDRKCTACHTTGDWRPSTIDTAAHARFGFPLANSHERIACADCHHSGQFTGTAKACSACHPDVRHRNRLGALCERCHDDTSWSHTPRFDHDETAFRLERGHAGVACVNCHGVNGMRLVGVTAPTACQTCHATPHGRQFGDRCTQCHDTASFRRVSFDHARTDFPLELRHATVRCAACHDDKQRRVANRTCRTCHGDPHRGANSIDCSDCHRPDRWRIIRFDHDLTAYPLVGRHRLASCGSCHTNPNWTGVRTDCIACHVFDRPRTPDHLTKVACDDCHSPVSWRTLHR